MMFVNCSLLKIFAETGEIQNLNVHKIIRAEIYASEIKAINIQLAKIRKPTHKDSSHKIAPFIILNSIL